MPVYEYECISCGSHFDKRQSFNDKPGALCPKCQCESKRVICPAPIIFKGKGFYITDHRKPDFSGNESAAPATAPVVPKVDAPAPTGKV